METLLSIILVVSIIIAKPGLHYNSIGKYSINQWRFVSINTNVQTINIIIVYL